MIATSGDFGELDRGLARLIRRLAELEWEAESLLEKIRAARRRHAGEPETPPSGPGRNRSYARRGVRILLVHRAADGEILVRIEDCGQSLSLGKSERLLDVLRALCSTGGRRTTNGLVPVKSNDELVREIQRISGEREAITHSCLRNHIMRLRRRLVRARIDPRLVETAEGGYRFRLRDGGEVIDQAA